MTAARIETVPVVLFKVAGEQATGCLDACEYTVVYDGTCKVCGKIVRKLNKWDRAKRMQTIPSQAAGVRARFPWIPARAYQESVQLIGPGGRTWQGAAAVEKILELIPRGRLISWIFKIPFARPLAERFYRWFARNRYQFGCGEHCSYRGQNVEYADGEQ